MNTDGYVARRGERFKRTWDATDWLHILGELGVAHLTAAQWSEPFADEVQPSRFSKGMDDVLAFLPQVLHETGMLDDTLVICRTEFGRTPWLNALGGRDHWPQSGCALFAGAGVPQGQVLGDTGRCGDEVNGRAVSPSDIVTTMLVKLGVECSEIRGVRIPELG